MSALSSHFNTEGGEEGRTSAWDWKESFGHPVYKDNPIWEKYVTLATTHDDVVIGAMNHNMDILLVFSGLFSAVVTTLIVQSDGGLLPPDQLLFVTKVLGKVIFDQLDQMLRVSDPSASAPTFPSIFTKDYSADTPVLLWYISLDCALLVAGGAVCMKIWLLAYQRRNNAHQVSYYRAIYHQQNYANFRRWYVPQWGDILGCIVLINLIPFFYGCVLRFTGESYGLLRGTATAVLAIYLAYLVFTTLVGIFVPNSPYQTPISYLFRTIPQALFQLLAANILYWVFMSLISLSGILLIYTMGSKVVEKYVQMIFLLVAPLLLNVSFGLRDGLKMGRISHFVPLMGLFIMLFSAGSMFFIILPRLNIYYDNLPYYSYLYLPSSLIVPFTLVIIGLSHRFSSAKSERSFPVIPLIISTSGMVAAIVVSTRRLCLSMILAWVSMMILSAASLHKEAKIEEDTRESEALAWLITHTNDIQTLHCALACIPGIANTPMRREIIFKHSLQALTLLINSIVDAYDRRNTWEIRSQSAEDMGDTWTCDLERESLLEFYMACLAEVSGIHSQQWQGRSTWVAQVSTELRSEQMDGHRGWWHDNWYRLLTIPPSRRSIARDFCFHHHWYPWLSRATPEILQVDLRILSKHKNSYIRVLSRASMALLYPSAYPLHDMTNWPELDDSQTARTDFYGGHVLLIELRMVTTRVINAYSSSIRLDQSVLRYLRRYCISALRIWTVQYMRYASACLEAALTLAYVSLDTDPYAASVTRCGDAIAMKSARCIMALSRWHDCNLVVDVQGEDGDAKLVAMLAQSMLSATARYLQTNMGSIIGLRRMIETEGVAGVDENSYVTGLQHLEHALLEMSEQKWSIPMMDDVVLALHALYSIKDNISIPLLLSHPRICPALLITHLRSQLLISTEGSDSIVSMEVASQVLNKIKCPATAWSMVTDGSPSLAQIIATLSQSRIRHNLSTAFSVLLGTHIFHPSSITLSERISDNDHNAKLPNTERITQNLYIDVLPDHDLGLIKFYEAITADPSPLYEAISTSDRALDRVLVEKCLIITRLLVESPNLKHLVSDFLLRARYAEALSSVISCDDVGCIPLHIRKTAIHLFACLWKLAEGNSERGVTEKAGAPYFIAGASLGDVAKGVNLVVNQRGSLDLGCIASWTEQLRMFRNIQSHRIWILEEIKLLEALRRAIPLSDFGKPVEAERKAVSIELYKLQKQASRLNSVL
ncbi:hypothetical protein FRC03_010687 [Tulasnella sp. 419]|nr:hypothetical protein FRC03_010687 [Tulasnella sp. 419]